MLLPVDALRCISTYLPITDAVSLQQASPVVVVDGKRQRVSLLDPNVHRTIEFLKTARGYQRTLYAICTDDVRLFKSAWMNAPCRNYVPMVVNARASTILEFLLSVGIDDYEYIVANRCICERKPIPMLRNIKYSISTLTALNYLVDLMATVTTDDEYYRIERSYRYIVYVHRSGETKYNKHSVLDHIASRIRADPCLLLKITPALVNHWDTLGFLSSDNPLRLFLGEVPDPHRSEFLVDSSCKYIKAYLDGKPESDTDKSKSIHNLRLLARCYLELTPGAKVDPVSPATLGDITGGYQRIRVTPEQVAAHLQTEDCKVTDSFLYILPNFNPIKYIDYFGYGEFEEHDMAPYNLPNFEYDPDDRVTPDIIATDLESISFDGSEFHPVNIAYHLHRQGLTSAQVQEIGAGSNDDYETIVKLLDKYERGKLPRRVPQ